MVRVHCVGRLSTISKTHWRKHCCAERSKMESRASSIATAINWYLDKRRPPQIAASHPEQKERPTVVPRNPAPRDQGERGFPVLAATVLPQAVAVQPRPIV